MCNKNYNKCGQTVVESSAKTNDFNRKQQA